MSFEFWKESGNRRIPHPPLDLCQRLPPGQMGCRDRSSHGVLPSFFGRPDVRSFVLLDRPGCEYRNQCPPLRADRALLPKISAIKEGRPTSDQDQVGQKFLEVSHRLQKQTKILIRFRQKTGLFLLRFGPNIRRVPALGQGNGRGPSRVASWTRPGYPAIF